MAETKVYETREELALLPRGEYILKVESPSGKVTWIPLTRDDVLRNHVEGYPVCLIELQEDIYLWVPSGVVRDYVDSKGRHGQYKASKPKKQTEAIGHA